MPGNREVGESESDRGEEGERGRRRRSAKTMLSHSSSSFLSTPPRKKNPHPSLLSCSLPPHCPPPFGRISRVSLEGGGDVITLPPGGIGPPLPLSGGRWMGRVGPAGATGARNLDSINWQSKTTSPPTPHSPPQPLPNLIYLLQAADDDSPITTRRGTIHWM